MDNSRKENRKDGKGIRIDSVRIIVEMRGQLFVVVLNLGEIIVTEFWRDNALEQFAVWWRRQSERLATWTPNDTTSLREYEPCTHGDVTSVFEVVERVLSVGG